jgi:hypothetical protein
MPLIVKLKTVRYSHQEYTNNLISLSHTGIAPLVYSPLLPITTSDSSTCLTYTCEKNNPCSSYDDVLFQDQQDYKDQAVSASITTPEPGFSSIPGKDVPLDFEDAQKASNVR